MILAGILRCERRRLVSIVDGNSQPTKKVGQIGKGLSSNGGGQGEQPHPPATPWGGGSACAYQVTIPPIQNLRLSKPSPYSIRCAALSRLVNARKPNGRAKQRLLPLATPKCGAATNLKPTLEYQASTIRIVIEVTNVSMP